MENITPMFKVSTSYKAILRICRDFGLDFNKSKHCLFFNHKDQNKNTMDVLVQYRIKDACTISPYGEFGIEKYIFDNTEHRNDYYNLLNMVIDYQDFLSKNVPANYKHKEIAKDFIDEFDNVYNGRKQRYYTRNMNMKNIYVKPFAKNLSVVIVPDTKEVIQISDKYKPVFAAGMKKNSSDIYVYEMVLIENLFKKIGDHKEYITKPCIDISLFKDSESANKYYQHSVEKMNGFKQHPEYNNLFDKNLPAFYRFIEYAKSNKFDKTL